MYDTRESALAGLQQLGLPAVIERIWSGSGPPRLRGQWEAPRRYFEIKPRLLAHCPRLESAIPILEANRERILAFDQAQGEFIDVYYDDADCRTVGSYQQLLSLIFVEFGYAGLTDLVEALAAELDYRYLGPFLQFMGADDEQSAEDAKWAFVRSTP
jgi:hypothetical protein